MKMTHSVVEVLFLLVAMAAASPFALKVRDSGAISLTPTTFYAQCGESGTCAEAACNIQATNFWGCNGGPNSGPENEGDVTGECSNIFTGQNSGASYVSMDCGGDFYGCTVNGQYMLDYYTSDQTVHGGPCNWNSDIGEYECALSDSQNGVSVCTGH